MLRSHKKLTKKEMKQDSLIIITAKTVEYIRNEWVKIGSIILGVIVIVSVSLFTVRGLERSEINAYDIAINAFINNEPEATELLTKYINSHGGSKRAAGILINLGNQYYARRDYDSAESYFKKYIKKFSKDPLYGFNAYNALGGIYEEKENYIEAGKIYEEFISKYDKSFFVPKMYLNAGNAYYLGGDKDSAIRNYNKIVNSYGDSKEKQEAIFYLEMLQDD
ncbi:MAG TPA: tetratricopeptide repeat protein [bacterium]|nr:tetratricopeptide repeat protein [bacterium]